MQATFSDIYFIRK